MTTIPEIKVYQGDGIHEVALRAIGYAECMNRIVSFKFNGVILAVLPSSSWVEIVDSYLKKSTKVFDFGREQEERA
jgi:hypothetical protein